MISIDEALKLIAEHVSALGGEPVPLLDSVGRRLSVPLKSDVDSPPHDKSLMDGYAIKASDSLNRNNRLLVIETITAGQIPGRTVTEGTAVRIMTGAPIPSGADAVVMNELTRAVEMDGQLWVELDVDEVRAGTSIMRCGQAMKTGQTVFEVGHIIRPHDIGLLAEIGVVSPMVYCQPSIAVLSTGDELVEYGSTPPPGKIRNSNEPMVTSLARKGSSAVLRLGTAPDNFDQLRECVIQGRSADVIVLTGGVSEGIVDLVPRVLKDVGFAEVFHKVSIKPGKPIWFGTSVREGRNQLAFGLPGNPVSSLVCFEVFVRFAIERLGGSNLSERKMIGAILSQAHQVRGPRPTYWPVRFVQHESPTRQVEPLVWQGSSDLRCLGQADALASLPPRDTPYPAGHSVEILVL
jgi:molybdopterin molybdotransferase